MADLRAAAAEAGISSQAFEAALAEYQAGASAPAHGTRPDFQRRTSRWALAAVAAAVIIFGLTMIVIPIAVSRGSETRPVAMTQVVISLQCLSPTAAAELIRPILNLDENLVIASGQPNTRQLTVTANSQQWESISDPLAKEDGAGSNACGVRP